MNLQQRRLSTLTLFLTDSRNRPIGRPPFSGSGTAAGSTTGGVLNSEFQSTQGNLFLTATVRIDVVQVSMPARLHAPPPPVSQPRLNPSASVKRGFRARRARQDGSPWRAAAAWLGRLSMAVMYALYPWSPDDITTNRTTTNMTPRIITHISPM
jgi:hypothetical protein